MLHLVQPSPNGTSTTNGHAPAPPNTSTQATVRGALDPYAPIEKARLVTPDGMRSNGHTVRLADPTQPGGWRECGVVSPSYLLVENAAVRDLAHEVADRSGLGFENERVFFDGKRYGLYLSATEKGLVETTVGDYVGLGLAFVNSYDGSQKLQASLFVHRLACLNGMLVPDLLGRVAVRHDPSGVHWEDEVARVLAAVDRAPERLYRFAEAARTLASMRITASRLREIRSVALASMPVTLWGQTVDRLLAHEELTGWGLLNAATNVLWHAEKPTAAKYAHNEAATSALVRFALSGERRN
ncbi:MAG TPA: DUF932 domain-containing protein [Rubricoccaceae bacterium]